MQEGTCRSVGYLRVTNIRNEAIKSVKKLKKISKAASPAAAVSGTESKKPLREGPFHIHLPVTIQINLDQRFWLNLFSSHLQHIVFLDKFPGQRLWHESLRRPSIEPVRRHDVPNTFGSFESRDFRTRKNPSVNRFSLAVSSLPQIPLSVYKGQRSKFI